MPVPVVSVSQMREWEAASWKAGRKPAAVIDRVGAAIAQSLERLTPPGARILFLAGPGNNGADARAARRHLVRKRASALLEISDPVAGLKRFSRIPPSGFDWIVDGLFGVGLNRPLDAAWSRLIEAVNDTGRPIAAVDISSGLNADSGQPQGAAIAAEITLTVAAPKRGLLAAPQFTGRIDVLTNVGLIDCPCESELQWTLAGDFRGWPPRRPVDGHKGTFGHAVIHAGSLGYHGAAVLSGRGAQRARPGLVTVVTRPKVYLPVASQCQAVMVRPWQPGAPPPKSATALLYGSGLVAPDFPAAAKAEIRRVWAGSKLAVVADAGALPCLPRGRTTAGAVRVVTPHPGEAGALLGLTPKEVQADRLGSVRRLSRIPGGCWVVLKGAQTLVGSASGPVYVNSTGNPELAQGGSGDLLGGYLTGLLAQMPWREDPLRAARYAVWEHGAAADRLSRRSRNWTVEDLAVELGQGAC